MAVAVRFIADPRGLQEIFESPAGPWARDLARRAIRVESQAKVNASGRPGPRVRTGRLRSSIQWRLVQYPNELVAEVRAPVSYARFVELGTDRARPFPFLRPALAAAN